MSRAEDILQATIDGTEYTAPSESRIETLLIELKNTIEQGGSGFSDDYAKALSMTINDQTFVVTAQLIDQNGNNLGNAQTIDLPLESVVVGGSYNDNTKKVVLTLQNGNTVEFSVADLVSGLQSTVLGSWTAGSATTHQTPAGTDTVLQALQKIDNNQRNDETNISTLSEQVGYAISELEGVL